MLRILEPEARVAVHEADVPPDVPEVHRTLGVPEAHAFAAERDAQLGGVAARDRRRNDHPCVTYWTRLTRPPVKQTLRAEYSQHCGPTRRGMPAAAATAALLMPTEIRENAGRVAHTLFDALRMSEKTVLYPACQ